MNKPANGTDTASVPAAEPVETRSGALSVNADALDTKIKPRKPDMDAIRSVMEASHPAARDVTPQEEPLFDALHAAAAAVLSARTAAAGK